jgi:hypothetical protein
MYHQLIARFWKLPLCTSIAFEQGTQESFKVSNEGITVSLINTHFKLTFDRVMNAADGCISGLMMKFLRAEHTSDRFTHALIGHNKIYKINHLHILFGHCT